MHHVCDILHTKSDRNAMPIITDATTVDVHKLVNCYVVGGHGCAVIDDTTKIFPTTMITL